MGSDYPRTEFRELGGEQIPVSIGVQSIGPAFDKLRGALLHIGEAAKAFNMKLQEPPVPYQTGFYALVGPLSQDALSAGQVRALRRLSREIKKFTCPYCMEVHSHPPVHAAGIYCPYCGNHECTVRYYRKMSSGGYTWMATYEVTPNQLVELPDGEV